MILEAHNKVNTIHKLLTVVKVVQPNSITIDGGLVLSNLNVWSYNFTCGLIILEPSYATDMS